MASMLHASRMDGRKHYSFLNPLDDIAVHTVKLDAGTNASSRAEQDATIERLSVALYSLAEGLKPKQLPVLPFSYHDNGAPPGGQYQPSTFVEPTQDMEQNRPYRRAQHIPRISLGDSFDEAPFARFTGLETGQRAGHKMAAKTVADVPSHKRSSSEAGALRSGKRLSSSLSRPISMYSLTKRSADTTDRRPTTSATVADPTGLRKKSITYNDQRCAAPSLEKELSRPISVSQSARKRFKIPASLKDFHFKSEKRRKSYQNSSPPPPLPSIKHLCNFEKIEDIRPTQMTVQEALAFPPASTPSFPPLHDAVESGKFTSDCRKELALKPDTMKIAGPTLHFSEQAQVASATECLSQAAATSSTQNAAQATRGGKHAHRFSEVESISSSILDYEWPQPDAYRERVQVRQTFPDAGRPRPDSGLGGLLNLAAMPCPLQGPLYPPPLGSLPPIPSILPHSSNPQPSGFVLSKIVSTKTTFNTAPPSRGQRKSAAVQSKSRLTALAETKGLRMDINIANVNESLSSDDDDTAPVLPSPLRLKSQKSQRNVKIESLRRRHLSSHDKEDSPRVDDGDDNLDLSGCARRGSAPDKMQNYDARHRLSRQSIHRRCTSNGRIGRATTCSLSASDHDRQSIRSATGHKSNHSSGRVQKPLKSAPRSQQLSASFQETLDTLSRGGSIQSLTEGYIDETLGDTTASSKVCRSEISITDYRHHLRQCSVESHPSTMRSSLSPARSTDTEITVPSPCKQDFADKIHGREKTSLKTVLDPPFEFCNERNDKDYTDTDILYMNQAMYSIHNDHRLTTDLTSCCIDETNRSQKSALASEQMPPRRRSSRQQAKAQLAHDVQFELDQLDQMKRVYRAMHTARDRDRARGHRARSYAEVLDDHRITSAEAARPQSLIIEPESISKRTSYIIAKIEADLEQSPPKQHLAMPKATSVTPLLESNTPTQPGDADIVMSIPSSDVTSFPSQLDSKRRTSNARLSIFPATKTSSRTYSINSSSATKASTMTPYSPSRTRRSTPPFSTASPMNSRKHARKRYSFVSIYNTAAPYFTESPTSSISPEYRTPVSRSGSVPQLTPPSEGRELQLAATIATSPVDLDLNMDVFINSSSRIDQAIDNFVERSP